MKKKIKKYGDAVVITFSPEEQEAYDIKVGDWFDVELAPIQKKKRKK